MSGRAGIANASGRRQSRNGAENQAEVSFNRRTGPFFGEPSSTGRTRAQTRRAAPPDTSASRRAYLGRAAPAAPPTAAPTGPATTAPAMAPVAARCSVVWPQPDSAAAPSAITARATGVKTVRRMGLILCPNKVTLQRGECPRRSRPSRQTIKPGQIGLSNTIEPVVKSMARSFCRRSKSRSCKPIRHSTRNQRPNARSDSDTSLRNLITATNCCDAATTCESNTLRP